jgi:hypothetical protein
MFSYQCLYIELDLKRYDESYAGSTVKVLQNPTRKFRRDFVAECFRSNSATWAEMLPTILGCENDQLTALLDDLPPEIMHWLLIPHMRERAENDTTPVDLNKDVIWPFVLTVWDEYVDGQIKAHARR